MWMESKSKTNVLVGELSFCITNEDMGLNSNGSYFFYSYIFERSHSLFAQSAGAVECTDCTSAEG